MLRKHSEIPFSHRVVAQGARDKLVFFEGFFLLGEGGKGVADGHLPK